MLSFVLLTVAVILITILSVAYFCLTAIDRKILFAQKKKLVINDKTRSYLLFTPKNIKKFAKIIFVFHGYAGDGRQIAYLSGLHNSAGRNTIVVYPDASKANKKELRRGWNAGYCCGSGWSEAVDDVGYISALIDRLIDEYDIDPHEIYAVGYSNGGMMVHQLASEIPDKFAGFAAVSSSIGTEAGQAKLRVAKPIILLQGKEDRVIPFNGGAGNIAPALRWLGFKKVIEAWEKVNSCSRKKVAKINPGIEKITYSSFKQPLEIHTFSNMKHQWPNWRLVNFWHRETLGSKTIISFFDSLQ